MIYESTITTQFPLRIEKSTPTMNCNDNFGNQKESVSGSLNDQGIGVIAVLGNCLFSLAFLTSSYFIDSVEIGFLVFRLLIIAAHIASSYVALHKACDSRVVLWSIIFILVNSYKLLQLAYNHKPIRIPGYLSDIYNDVFKPLRTSRSDFLTLIQDSKVVGIGKGEFLFSEGDAMVHDPSLSILVSGHMTVWCDGVPLHAIKPTQMINSIEWKSLQTENEELNDAIAHAYIPKNMKHQVSLCVDEDSMYIKLNNTRLQHIRMLYQKTNVEKKKQTSSYLWHTLDSVVCKDISQKMYHMNDSFDKAFEINKMKETDFRSRRNPLFRSLSLDALDTASNGKIVTENWLKANGRSMQLICLHDSKTGLPKSKYNLSRKRIPLCNNFDYDAMIHEKSIPWKKTDIAYMLLHSNPNLQRPADNNLESLEVLDYNGGKVVLPSLRLQKRKIDLDSCKFLSTDVENKWNLENALNHCGFCNFCKPMQESEGGGVHPSLQN